MLVTLEFEISTDEFEKTLSMCKGLGAKIIRADKNGSPNGYHDFKVEMPCDSLDDYNGIIQVMSFYIDDPVPTCKGS